MSACDFFIRFRPNSYKLSWLFKVFNH